MCISYRSVREYNCAAWKRNEEIANNKKMQQIFPSRLAIANIILLYNYKSVNVIFISLLLNCNLYQEVIL